MRLLHTSDWHLGQDFHRFDRTHEHWQFLDGLVDTLAETETDVLLIAGDVFDVSNPPASAQRLFFEFLVAAKRRSPQLRTIVIAGNHDSGARLEAPAQLLKSLDVTVVGRVVSTPQGIVSAEEFLVPLCKFHTETEKPEAVCIALPFLKTADVQWPDDVCHYTDAIVRTYQQAIDAARARFGESIPLIALGHLHARGGTGSKDSERPLIIGGEEAVPLARIADQIAYFALGHLHLAQEVGGCPHIRYSGSPLPMSFSELRYRHQMVLVDLKPDGSVTHEILHLRRPVELLRFPAQPAELDQVIEGLSQLDHPAVPQAQMPYLEVQVLLSGPTPDLRSRIESALKDKNVRLAKITNFRPETGDLTNAPVRERMLGLDSLRQLDPLSVFKDLHRRKYKREPDAELLSAFEDVLRDVTSGDEQ